MAQELQKKIWVTLSGLPLTIGLQWPFHRSTSGADFWVLHADVHLENSDGLHAPMAVNLSATVREVLPSLEPRDVEAPVINALRKEVDKRQIEFLKSGKLKPVAFSSRYYDFKRQKWVFGKAADDAIATFIERKVYWQTKARRREASLGRGSGGGAISGNDAGTSARNGGAPGSGKWIAADGWRVGGSNPGANGTGERFESAMRSAVEEVEKKHAYERG